MSDSNDVSIEFAPVIKVQVSKDGTGDVVEATLEGNGKVDGDLQVTGEGKVDGDLLVTGKIRMLTGVEGTHVELAYDSAYDRFTISRVKQGATTKKTTFAFHDL